MSMSGLLDCIYQKPQVQIFPNFWQKLPCSYLGPLLAALGDMLHRSGFVDDVVLAVNWPGKGNASTVSHLLKVTPWEAARFALSRPCTHY